MKKWFLPTMVLLVLGILLMPTTLAEGNVKVNDFSSNVTNGTVTLYTRFTGNVTGNITNWKFTFTNVVTGNTTNSGGTDSVNITTHHNIKKPGVYNVTLLVWGPDGNDSLTKIAYVTANMKNSSTPVADFTASSTSGSAPLNVSFTDNSTGATAWYWKFGDGNSSNKENPTHNYTTDGKYTVILAVKNANGWSAKTQEITVGSGLPVADFSADNSSGSVQFTDLSQNATSWSWDFGDGENSTEESPLHTYSAAGNYTVTLTASNENGSVSKVSEINLTEENIANEDSDSSSSSSSSDSSDSDSGSSSGSSIGSATIVSSTSGSTSSSTNSTSIISVNGTDNVTEAVNGTDNVTAAVNETDNVTQAVNETASDIQGIEQTNESPENTEMPEQTESSNNSTQNTSGSTSTPGFEMIYGIAGLVGVALYRRR